MIPVHLFLDKGVGNTWGLSISPPTTTFLTRLRSPSLQARKFPVAFVCVCVCVCVYVCVCCRGDCGSCGFCNVSRLSCFRARILVLFQSNMLKNMHARHRSHTAITVQLTMERTITFRELKPKLELLCLKTIQANRCLALGILQLVGRSK